MKKIVIMASGRGSNFCALADAVLTKKIPDTEIIALICNRPEALALEEARNRGIRSICINHKTCDRATYNELVLTQLQGLQPDWICLAGYMLILPESIINKFPNRILNIHPSLLPKFPGLHAVRQALTAGESETGCTVHFVTAGVDEGPVILQGRIAIQPGDTEDSVHDRLRPVEHSSYIEALKRLVTQH